MIKAPFVFLFIFLLQPNSCSKKNVATDNSTKNNIDSTKIDDNNCGVDPALLLVDKSWQVYKLTFVSGDEIRYFNLDGLRNTTDFSEDKITFNKDGTGLYTHWRSSFSIKWQFIGSDKTKIRYTILDYDMGLKVQGVNLVVNWENVVLTSNSLQYAEIYTNSDSRSILCSGTRISL